MNKLITASIGSFPRIGEEKEEQKLREAYFKFDRQGISKREILSVEGEVIDKTLQLQCEAGLDLVTDGQIRWNDPISHFMRVLNGVKVGALTRFFDTNTYYRQPVIEKKISIAKPLIVSEFLFAQRITPKSVKPVLTGPCTLARLSLNNAYASTVELMEAITHFIAQEVDALSHAGAFVIQIDEPVVLQNPQDLHILPALLDEIASYKGKAKLALYTYFGDAAPCYNQLQQCPVDIIGLDFTYNHRLHEVIAASGVEKQLGLGLIDGRNTKMESAADVFPVLESLLQLSGMETCYLNPSCGLEYLPRSKATAKLKNMVSLRDDFTGEKNEQK